MSTLITGRPNGARRRGPIRARRLSSPPPPRRCGARERPRSPRAGRPARRGAAPSCAASSAARPGCGSSAGERLSFAEEARGLYGVRPELRPLADYDPVLARIERWCRARGRSPRGSTPQDRFVIPRDRLDAVMRAAIAECRRRTVAHIPLPAGEAFTLEFVTGRSWSGYNWYQGNYRSLIQVNTDLPVRMGRAIDLGCHEGYPGHHAYNMLLERDLARGRGWVEYMVYPLYSPQRLIAEGSANYGIELAFPGDERLAFETADPLSARRPADRRRRHLSCGCRTRSKALAGARFTIARDLLEGRISRERAIELTQQYQLDVAPPRRAVDRLHRAISRLCDQLRARRARW